MQGAQAVSKQLKLADDWVEDTLFTLRRGQKNIERTEGDVASSLELAAKTVVKYKNAEVLAAKAAATDAAKRAAAAAKSVYALRKDKVKLMSKIEKSSLEALRLKMAVKTAQAEESAALAAAKVSAKSAADKSLVAARAVAARQEQVAACLEHVCLQCLY